MELGEHLVKELGFEGNRDTLSRWLAHHIAELLHDINSAETPGERRESERRAVETILKIWDHRASLRGNANPLTQYRDLLRALRRITSDANPWLSMIGVDSREAATGRVYGAFCRLITSILALDLPHSRRITPKVVHRFIPKEESRLVSALQVRFILASQLDENISGDIRQSAGRESNTCEDLIDKTIVELKALRKALRPSRRRVPAIRKALNNRLPKDNQAS